MHRSQNPPVSPESSQSPQSPQSPPAFSGLTTALAPTPDDPAVASPDVPAAPPPPPSPDAPEAASPPTDAPDLSTALRMATMRLSRRLRSENASDCTEAQYGVLAILVHFGPMSPGELAERERVQAPSMTRTVASLEDLGYVERTRHATDGRQVVVTVTEAGREVVAETKRWRNAWLDRILADLAPEEREIVREAAQIILRVTEL